MLFNSASYLVFFPVVVLCYFIMPKKLQNIWLLAVSYFFYMQWNAKYALLLLLSTFVTYLSGYMIEYLKKKEKILAAKWCLGISFLINLGLLMFFKYINFLVENINRVFGVLHIEQSIPVFDILLPVGISFYIFQALSYTMDVYRGQIKATRNFLKYALFVSFFPQLVAGPIERSKNLLGQFDEEHTFDVERVRSGLLLMLWGLFMKIVIADNIAPTVTMIYENYFAYSGIEIIVATVLFAFQIYCDFAGYSLIAIGSARVLGFRLMRNFDSPYLAGSVTDFWKRWHISLTGWFRDYLYIPLGGNRKGELRKYMNVFFIFLVSGIWHGSAWTYIAWGALNGIYMIVGSATAGIRSKAKEAFHVDVTRFSYKLGTRLLTFALVDFSWMFFRSTGFSTTFHMIKKCLTDLQFGTLFGLVFENIGMSVQTMVVLLIALLLLLVVDIMMYKKIDVIEFVFKQGIWFRWMVYLGLLFTILIFGVYGNTYEQTQFIYFQF